MTTDEKKVKLKEAITKSVVDFFHKFNDIVFNATGKKLDESQIGFNEIDIMCDGLEWITILHDNDFESELQKALLVLDELHNRNLVNM